MTKEKKRSFFIFLFFTFKLDCIFLRVFWGYVLSTFCLSAKRNNNNSPLKTPKLLFFLLHTHTHTHTRIFSHTHLDRHLIPHPPSLFSSLQQTLKQEQEKHKHTLTHTHSLTLTHSLSFTHTM